MSKITVNNATFYYELHGSGHPLVLIAGYSGTAASWAPMIEGLSQNFQILAFDNRGVGQTLDDNCPLSLELMAEDVIALCDALKLNKPHIVGRSMGGSITQIIAAKYPEKIHKIGILVSTAKWRPAALMCLEVQLQMQEQNINPVLHNNLSLALLAGTTYLDNPRLKKDLISTLVNAPSTQTTSDQRRQYEALVKFDATTQLDKIRASTLILYGKDDMLALPQESMFMAKHIPHSKLVELDCGHLVVLEQTQQLVNELTNFLTPN